MTKVTAWAVSMLVMAAGAHADMGRECQPRALTAEEKQAADSVAERLRKALPPAPAGWATRDERTDLAAGSCPMEGGSARAIPQPVTISVLRNYVRQGPPAQAPRAEPPAQPPSSNPEQVARAAALEKQLAELKGRESAAGRAYQEARRAGDSAAQREAIEASREVRAEMAPVHRELTELRRAMREERSAAAAQTRAAQARTEEARANRRDASVSIQTNLRQAQTRGARPISVAGAPLALRDGNGAIHVLLGAWQQTGNFAVAHIDESAPTTRVHSVRVRIDGNEAVSDELLQGLDMKAVAALVDASKPAAAQTRRAASQDGASPVDIVLKTGTKDYRSNAAGECKAASQASIHGVSASLYSVSQRSSGQSLNFTLWQPKDGSPAMLSLHISDGSSRYEVDTVKGGSKYDTKGSGKATLQRVGAGGVFTIDGKAASGETIRGTINCSRFVGIQAEGG